jgi:predicted ATPase
MIHHAIINPEMHKLHWTDYLYQLQDSGQQASLVIATHAIWLMAILPLTDKYRFQTYDYNWVGYGEENSLTKVHGIVGTSRKMVYFQYLIRVASKASTTRPVRFN